MNPQIMRAMLKKLRLKKGCQIDDFSEWMPEAALYTDAPVAPGSGLFHPTDDLRQLVQWNLVEAYYKNDRLMKASEIRDSNVSKITFYLSPFAAQLEDTLNISLAADPIFGEPIRSKAWPELFMLMPFIPQMKPIFDKHVKKVAAEIGLTAERADAFLSRGSIIEDVWSAIYYAKVIVADCTKQNPNVFYEIGVAHTLGT